MQDIVTWWCHLIGITDPEIIRLTTALAAMAAAWLAVGLISAAIGGVIAFWLWRASAKTRRVQIPR